MKSEIWRGGRLNKMSGSHYNCPLGLHLPSKMEAETRMGTLLLQQKMRKPQRKKYNYMMHTCYIQASIKGTHNKYTFFRQWCQH